MRRAASARFASAAGPRRTSVTIATKSFSWRAEGERVAYVAATRARISWLCPPSATNRMRGLGCAVERSDLPG